MKTEESHECESTKIAGKDERAEEAILKIRDLDTSIRELELQLKAARKETTDLQSETCEKLRVELSHDETSENIFIKNTRRFLRLFDESAGKEKFEKHDTLENAVGTEPWELQNEAHNHSSSVADEKDRLELLISNEMKDSSMNPYRINENLGIISQEMQDELKDN